MRKEPEGRSALADEVAAFIVSRGAPAGSSQIAVRFLKTRELSESIATNLLRPALEAAGLKYEAGAGWHLPAGPSRESPRGPLRVGAAFDPQAGRLVLHPPGGDFIDVTPVMIDPSQARGIARERRILSLRSCLRGHIRMKRGATLSDICAILRVRWLDSGDAEGEACAIAACLSAAGVEREDGIGLAAAESAMTLPAGITREDIERLPERPGVYRFFDKREGLLYVGKAANLRRRVKSYFALRAQRPARSFQAEIHHLEFTETGSELQALLAEARQIARLEPRGNTQREVRERGRRYASSRCFALLLAGARSGTISVLVVKEGRYLGHARLGSRGGGVATIRRLLERAMAPVTRRRFSLRDDQILNSWLARSGEAARRIDLDSCRDATQALLVLQSACRETARSDREGWQRIHQQGEWLRPGSEE